MTINSVANSLHGVSLTTAQSEKNRFSVSAASGQHSKANSASGADTSETVASFQGDFAPKGADGKPLSKEDQQQVNELKSRDREVRAHEQAHMAAGAGVVRGGAQYKYEKGPDGVNYAVEGEVSVDTSDGRTPEETLRKMERVRAAAMAPSDPSPQDRRIAAQASAKAAGARAEISENKKSEKVNKESDTPNHTVASYHHQATPDPLPGTLVDVIL